MPRIQDQLEEQKAPAVPAAPGVAQRLPAGLSGLDQAGPAQRAAALQGLSQGAGNAAVARALVARKGPDLPGLEPAGPSTGAFGQPGQLPGLTPAGPSTGAFGGPTAGLDGPGGAGPTEDASSTKFEGTHTVLRNPSSGREVVFLQRRLNLWGAVLVEDGIFGAKTASAVRDFQIAFGAKADGVVGPQTWPLLEEDQPGAALKKDKPKEPGDGLNDDPNEIGGFSPFVDAGVLSQPIAHLLHQMFQLKGFGADMAQFAHEELSNGRLIGLVRFSEVDKIKAKLAPKHHALLADDAKFAGNTSVNAITRGVPGEHRSYILFQDTEIANGFTGDKAAHDFVELELAHELTHHRNIDPNAKENTELPGGPEGAAHFVDVELAKQKTNTQFVHSGFIDELCARHVAWQVENDQKATPTKLKGGQYFKAALGFALKFTFYNDNGYMQDLHTKDEAKFREQVGMWMGEMVGRNFSSDAKKQALIEAYLQGEFMGAMLNGWAEPTVAADGDR